ncbi:LysE/ArgO family amino acid transporter [Tessaracoccus palaemonis]|uniref:LysE family transporter n=1 Tax=Tessaracoccus palaemonis TaxID=2829499 RepID=A0ABX8SI52_9ACTN|nr:LysE family transporter [Tessaracoccus palaemonis]QXT63067.1 LysE family transporter [Tessaracoccus palaemonis]
MLLLTTAVAGFTFGLGLIVAIGAQNAFVLRQGLRREHVGAVVAVCAVSDLALIAAGAAGLGAIVAAHPRVLAAVTILGAGVLLWYGISAARRAVRGSGELVADTGAGGDLRATLLTAVALTWLNPHVYLDTVVLLGSVSASYSTPWAFAVGAGAASIAWFSGLGFGARGLAPLFARPAAWRVFDAVIATTMVSIAASLLAGLA